jgi:hypothetical protein
MKKKFGAPVRRSYYGENVVDDIVVADDADDVDDIVVADDVDYVVDDEMGLEFGKMPDLIQIMGNYYGKLSKKDMKKIKNKKVVKFGKMPNLVQSMGNFSPSLISGYQEYLGATDSQRATHLSKIPKDLRSNFYSNV